MKVFYIRTQFDLYVNYILKYSVDKLSYQHEINWSSSRKIIVSKTEGVEKWKQPSTAL